MLNVSENATYRFDDPTTGERGILRVHRPGYHTLDEIESELVWLRAVHHEGLVSTAAAIPDLAGRPVVAVRTARGDDRYVTRFTWLDGEEPHDARLTPDFSLLGRIAARLHEHARRWRRPAGFVRPRWDVAGCLGSSTAGVVGHWGRWQDGVGVGSAELSLLGRAAGEVRDRLSHFGSGPARFGLIHADMRLANLLVEPEAAPGEGVHVIDFDDCGFGWFLYDVAAALSFMEDSPRVPELVDAWVGGYRSVASLSVDEIELIPTLIMLRRLLLVAWVGSHQDAPYPASLGAGFTRGTCELAEGYLAGRYLAGRPVAGIPSPSPTPG